MKICLLGFPTPEIRIRCQNSIIMRSFGNNYILPPTGNMYLVVQNVVQDILLTLKTCLLILKDLKANESF